MGLSRLHVEATEVSKGSGMHIEDWVKCFFNSIGGLGLMNNKLLKDWMGVGVGVGVGVGWQVCSRYNRVSGGSAKAT